MKPDKLIMIFGDFHIYSNHLEQVKELVSRKPYEFPSLIVNNNIDFFNIKEDDIKLVNYRSYGIIKADMAI